MTLRSRAAVAASLLLAAFAPQAAIVRLHFTGAVDQVDAALTSRLHVGDPVSVDLGYDTAAPALPGSKATSAVYDLLALDLDFGGYVARYQADPAHHTFITVLDNHPTASGLADAFGGTAWVPGGGTPVAGLPLQQGFIALYDFTEAVFGGTSLPVTLDLADFQAAEAGLLFCTDSGCGAGSRPSAVGARLDSLTVVPAPLAEPASLALVPLCLGVALAAARKRVPAECSGYAGS